MINKLLWHEEAPLCVKCGLEVFPDNYLILTEKNVSNRIVNLYFHTECRPTHKELLRYLGFKKGK